MGNNRVTFTTNPKEIDFTLNYESNTADPDDEALFDNLQNVITADVHDRVDASNESFNHNQVQLLNGAANGVVGSVLTIPVGPGDKVSAEVYAKYLAPTGTNNPAAAIGNLVLGAITGSTGLNNYEGAINNGYGTNGTVTNLINANASSTEPMAFINLLFLPDDVTSSIATDHFAFKQITSASSNSQALLALDQPYEAPESGYVVVYLSNESAQLTEVYFDDLEVTVEEHPVIETSDYYPFGLQHDGGYQRITAMPNRWKFNGVEETTDLGLNFYQTLFRGYDPSVGRFMQNDPLSDFMPGISTYSFGFNNPTNFGDPYGLAPDPFTKLFRKIRLGVKRLGQRIAGDKNPQTVIKTKDGEQGMKKREIARHRGEPKPAPPVAKKNETPPGPLKGMKEDPSFSKPSIAQLKPVDNSQQGGFPAGTRINFRNAPFGANSSVIRNPNQTDDFLRPIAETLKNDPTMAVTIQVRTNLNQNQLNQVINMNGGTNNGTLNTLLTQRGQAIQRAILDLGADQRQVVFMFVPNATGNGIRMVMRQLR